MYVHYLIQLDNLIKGQGNVYELSNRACDNNLWCILARKVDSSLIWLGQGQIAMFEPSNQACKHSYYLLQAVP